MRESAGLLLWRRLEETIEVLLVHPSGAYNRKAPWSIPKGIPQPGESLAYAAYLSGNWRTPRTKGAQVPFSSSISFHGPRSTRSRIKAA